ncbi:PilZ domain-containing protein [Roseibium sp. RKSG952]|uniref:PilZ domain-containing protein n=1 Tax=Roseibium sp. RKSG952 TaxID=2529384 RepID=UPI0018AD258D|nr:PilZ domain-containing protein [Roseibium sp. RKSG952]
MSNSIAFSKANGETSFKHEKRRDPRVKVSVLGRFRLGAASDHPCQVVDMSASGAALVSPVPVETGETATVFLDGFPALTGRVVRLLDSGFAVAFSSGPEDRGQVSSRLSELDGDRETIWPETAIPLQSPFTPTMTEVADSHGKRHYCQIVDLSLQTVTIATSERLALGERITIGRKRAVVTLHTDHGIVAEFEDQDNRHT